MRTVMIIDDNEDIVDLLSLMLRRRGYAVVSAGTGTQGLELLFSRPPPDLVLLDVQMPDMSGMDMLDRLQLGRPEIFRKSQIFFYTAGAAPVDDRVSGSLDKMTDVKNILSVILERVPFDREAPPIQLV